MRLKVSLGLCAFLVVLGWQGCGKPSSETPPPSQPSAPVAPPAAEPVPAPAPEAPKPSAKTVTIYRDTWGVPHIYADSDEAAAYGLGYAQAEDRLADMYANIRIACGSAAKYFGKDAKMGDQAMQLVDNAGICQNYWDDAPSELTALGESFMAGVKAYIAENPAPAPDWAIELEGWQCAAVGRAMILRWPIGNVFGDLEHKKKRTGASNEWSVSPSRSADGSAILLTDPHVSWEGLSVFYEARVHGAKLHMNGFFLVGSPIMAFGHTESVGWAPTTGGPDTGDVYEIKVDLSNMASPKYELNGEWHPAKLRMLNIEVKGEAAIQQPTTDTELGPVMDLDAEAGIAYVAASPYFKETGVFEQSYKMCLAKNCDEFYEAAGMLQLMDQNLMFADREGNIQYVRNGRTPIRPSGFDWNAPVPASEASMWKGIHPIADLVQIKNPTQGYMQNCNISPANMMKGSTMTPEKYPDYIYNVTWDTQNRRSERITALLDSDDSVTKDEAMEYALNVYDVLAKPWQAALKTASEKAGWTRMSDQSFADAVKAILDWDGQFEPDRTATVLYKTWRMKCNNKIDTAAIADGKPLSGTDQETMLAILAESINEVQNAYGSVLVPWGDVYRIGRGGKFYPAPGADFGGSTSGSNMTETLFDVRSSADKDNPGKFIADDGSCATMLMFMHKDGIESYTVIPWGQSANPDSPHYMDQGEQLYSKRKMKPTWFTKDEMMANKVSEKVLTIP
ncbi:MAG: penicillin acylase family protein [Candidatus Hydrogenedentes bacterium]|nr:penicillin acylase family protein [Candidatus Hydrogenedentota bacterium]